MKMTSGMRCGCALSVRKASSPSAQVITSMPSRFSATSRIFLTVNESSMTITSLLICCPLPKEGYQTRGESNTRNKATMYNALSVKQYSDHDFDVAPCILLLRTFLRMYSNHQ